MLLTADVDWASEYLIEFFIEEIISLKIKPLLFCTHKSKVIQKFFENNLIDVGIHPNFKNNSTHGKNVKDVCKHIINLFPYSEISRSHGFVDSEEIQKILFSNGIKYDSNKLKQDKTGICPKILDSGIKRVECFWSDGMIIQLTKDKLYNISNNIEITKTRITEPGYKVINLHPILFATNCYSYTHYLNFRNKTKLLTKTDVNNYQNKKRYGVKDYFFDIIKSYDSNIVDYKTIFN